MKRINQKCVFLDRDGVINVHDGYCTDPKSFILLEGVPEAIKLLNENNYLVVVASNQGAIARGLLTEQTLYEIHNKMKAQLAGHDAFVDAIYYCPHHPDGRIKELAFRCNCRKPMPGMLLEAAAKFNIDFSKSWLVGDSSSDVLAGQAVGVKTIKLPTTETTSDKSCNPNYKCKNLLEAVHYILLEMGEKS